MNPLAYLLVSLQLTSLMLAVIFFIAWKEFGRHNYALLWSVAFFVATIQWVLNLGSRHFFSSYELYWLLVNLISVVTTALALAGHRSRVGLKNNLAPYFAFGGGTWLLVAWFSLQQPHVGLRTAIVPLYTAVMMALVAHAVTRSRPRVQPAEWGMATVAMAFALCEVAAAVVILGGGAAGNPEAQTRYQAINFLALPAIYTGMGLFTVLVLASDMSKEMKTLALMDPLTGLLNVRGFQDQANRLFAAARRDHAPLSVIVCDLDHFKAVNDQYGHAIGDQVLTHFAKHLRKNARALDVIGRMGGEEFVLFLPNASLEIANARAETLRTSLAPLDAAADAPSIRVEASFGVALLSAADKDLAHFVRRADAALYQSKRTGRNRVTVA